MKDAQIQQIEDKQNDRRESYQTTLATELAMQKNVRSQEDAFEERANQQIEYQAKRGVNVAPAARELEKIKKDREK